MKRHPSSASGCWSACVLRQILTASQDPWPQQQRARARSPACMRVPETLRQTIGEWQRTRPTNNNALLVQQSLVNLDKSAAASTFDRKMCDWADKVLAPAIAGAMKRKMTNIGLAQLNKQAREYQPYKLRQFHLLLQQVQQQLAAVPAVLPQLHNTGTLFKAMLLLKEVLDQPQQQQPQADDDSDKNVRRLRPTMTAAADVGGVDAVHDVEPEREKPSTSSQLAKVQRQLDGVLVSPAQLLYLLRLLDQAQFERVVTGLFVQYQRSMDSKMYFSIGQIRHISWDRGPSTPGLHVDNDNACLSIGQVMTPFQVSIGFPWHLDRTIMEVDFADTLEKARELREALTTPMARDEGEEPSKYQQVPTSARSQKASSPDQGD